jgi:signal transduction histidine kinase
MQQQTEQVAEFISTGPAATIFAETGVAQACLASAGLAGPELATGRAAGAERRRVEAVVETLADLRGKGESLAEVAHDVRNMVTALGLYCDLLEEPGVLTAPFLHYASELRLVATASRRLVEKLLALDLRQSNSAGLSAADLLRSTTSGPIRTSAGHSGDSLLDRVRRWETLPDGPIANLAAEVLANRNLLAALAGLRISFTVDVEGGALPVRLTGEELTRILVNLVKNAAEAMPEGGRIQLGLHELPADADSSSSARRLVLTVEDNGPGIPRKALEKIFEPGYSTRSSSASRQSGWAAAHRGLGLSITRSIVEAAGGRVHASNRDPAGARFQIELPASFR